LTESKVFTLVAIFAIIFATSCKKEEMQALVIKPQADNALVLLKADTVINGEFGDLFYNKFNPEQQIFVVEKILLKSCGGEWNGTLKEYDEKKEGEDWEHIIECDPSNENLNCYVDSKGRIHTKSKL
jgi:hypothetical protein